MEGKGPSAQSWGKIEGSRRLQRFAGWIEIWLIAKILVMAVINSFSLALLRVTSLVKLKLI